MFINPLGTTGLLTPFLIGSYDEMFTYSANYDLWQVFENVASQTYMWDFFSYILSDWFNICLNTHFDQSAGTSHGVKLMDIG